VTKQHVVAEQAPPAGACRLPHRWEEIDATPHYAYDVCVACGARRARALHVLAAGSPSPEVEWVAGSWRPAGACLACPYRTECHQARQRAMDRRGAGAHLTCEYFAGHQAARGLDTPAGAEPLWTLALGVLRRVRRGVERLGLWARLQLRYPWRRG
jgi:hypothetical protein